MDITITHDVNLYQSLATVPHGTGLGTQDEDNIVQLTIDTAKASYPGFYQLGVMMFENRPQGPNGDEMVCLVVFAESGFPMNAENERRIAKQQQTADYLVDTVRKQGNRVTVIRKDSGVDINDDDWESQPNAFLRVGQITGHYGYEWQI